jgi:beta-glucanase (GH16 family)
LKTKVSKLKSAVALLVLATIAVSCEKSQETGNNDPLTAQNSQGLSRKAGEAQAAYELVWSDEFDSTTVDNSKWTVVTGDQHVHNELQAYTAEAVTVSRGTLNILASKTASDGKAYTSGKITTAGKFAIQYGRIEARISNANALGLTSEFIMQGTDFPVVGMPKSGEIDIMQHKNNDTEIYGGIQWDNEGWAVHRNTVSNSPVSYSVYAIEWDEKEIRYYVNDKIYQTLHIANNVNGTDEFHKPFFINLDMTVGGNFAGQNVTNALPTLTKVDYIRVYKSAGS